jgi:hypothetical protein
MRNIKTMMIRKNTKSMAMRGMQNHGNHQNHGGKKTIMIKKNLRPY